MPAQSFEGDYSGRMCVCAFIRIKCMHVYMSVCVYTVFNKKDRQLSKKIQVSTLTPLGRPQASGRRGSNA